MPDDPISFMFLPLASSSSGISDYAEIVEEEGDYSTPDGKIQFPAQIFVAFKKVRKFVWGGGGIFHVLKKRSLGG